MKRRSIEVISDKPKKVDGLLSHTGEITIGDYKETFVMPLNSWTLEEYQQQWQEGLERIKNNDKSCLVNLIQNMKKNPMIEMWVLHKVRGVIYIQQYLLNREIAKESNYKIDISDFNMKNCYEFIDQRIENEQGHGITENGTKVSEWHIDVDAI